MSRSLPTKMYFPSPRNAVGPSFLETPIVNEPGSTFLYNSMATYMLSAIVTKVTGERLIDYLMPRLFDPLGVSGIDWETDPSGYNSGGWGLRLHTEDMAKFGQLFLQDGVWMERRLLPEGWVAEASSSHIQQNPQSSTEERAQSDGVRLPDVALPQRCVSRRWRVRAVHRDDAGSGRGAVAVLRGQELAGSG